MIQLSGSESKSPSWPESAVNVNSSWSVAGVVPSSPLGLKFRLKSYRDRTIVCPKRNPATLNSSGMKNGSSIES